jgi:hypothetical protein
VRIRLAVGLLLGALLVTATASGGPAADGPTPLCNGGGCSPDWYKTDVAVTWSAPAGASLQACQFDTVSSDTTGHSLSCSAFYSASLSVTSTVTVKRDATPPTVGSGSPARGPDSNGWYTSPVSVTFSGSDATSGIASCTSTTYSGPDSSGATVSGSCTDAAGNAASGGAFSLKYDATGPSVEASATRAPDKDGWYTAPVSFSVSGSDAVSGLDSCNSPSYGGPDTGGGGVTATCRDKAGNSASRSVSIRYDSTRPEATGAALDRPPDHGEWYTKPVTVTFSGSDAASGIASCTSVTYSGPDGDASVNGTCTDRAGHTSAPRAFGFKYDDTAPTLTKAEAKKGDGFVTLSWAATGGVAAVTVTRADLAAAAAKPMYTGTGTSWTDRSVKNGVKYSYVLRVEDAAGNAVSKTLAATPRPKLYQPARGAKLRRAAPATFAWEAVPKATYYNFQLHRRVGGRWVKVLTRWPGKPWFALPRRWQGANGKTERLTAGRYRWYVWPATGLRSQRRYGKLEGSSEFSVR